jgi:hypothetical protein
MIDAKKYLEEIERYNSVIENKLAEIDQLKSLATSITTATSDTPVQSSGNNDRIGKIVADIADKEAELKRLVDELVDERNERIKIIEQLEDRLQYTVLYKRYMKLMKIEDIAEEQHYSSRWILKVHSKGLNNIQNILNSSH